MRRFTFLSSTLSLLSISLCADYTAEDDPDHPPQQQSFVSPSRFEARNSNNWIAVAEYLFWIPQEGGLYFAQKGLGENSAVFDGPLKQIKTQWESGFRLGLGGNMPYDGWDIISLWTWYQAHDRNTASGSVLPLWSRPNSLTIASAENVSGSWSLSYNVLDLEMARAQNEGCL
jgi:hypothetical protein